MGEEAMKESDVQAAMDTQLKVAADGLWYDEAAFIPQQIAWSAWHDFTSWSESGGSFERPSAERVDELRANDPSLTEEMILAGIVAMRSYEEGDDAGEIAAVWKAMGAQSPVREYIAGLRAQINRLPDPTRCAVSGTLLPDNPRRLPDQDQMCQIAAWSDPPSELLNDPTFEAIWQAIKTWDINVPAVYGGYCGATGNHVYAIHRALARLSPPQQPDPGDSLYEECLAVQDEPEILVTTEMLQAAGRAWLECGPVQVEQWTAIYRAMTALAPKNTASKWWPAQWQEGQARIAVLEGENVEFKLNNTKLLEAYSSISKKLGELQTEKRNQVGLRIGSMLPGSCDEGHPATNERAAAAAENNALTTQMDTLIQAGIQAYRDECTKQIAALEAAFESERNMRITMEDCLRDAQQTALRYKRDLAALEAENAALGGRVGELQSYSHEMAKEIDRRNNLDQQSEAYQYLKRLFLHVAPQCCVLPDLLGVCTQVDNAIAGLKIDLSALEAKCKLSEDVALAVINQRNALKVQLDAIADPDPTDLPDSPRRPDGTLVPASKPWTPPKDIGDKRRIGG